MTAGREYDGSNRQRLRVGGREGLEGTVDGDSRLIGMVSSINVVAQQSSGADAYYEYKKRVLWREIAS